MSIQLKKKESIKEIVKNNVEIAIVAQSALKSFTSTVCKLSKIIGLGSNDSIAAICLARI